MRGAYPQVAGWVDMRELESTVLAFWEERKIFDKVREKNRNGRIWSFIDGPITANNPMGIHHAWGRSLKDAFQRYHAMNGRRLRYQNGFDCQGLWVEVEVEKELGFTSKRDIEEYGIDRFVNRCKDRVRKYSAIITEQSKRLGYWMDWDDSYYTMSDTNNYTIWAFLKRCHERGLIYRGHDVMPWCPRCGTGLSQHEMSEGYEETTHLSLYVALPVRARPDEYLVVWTTTPWTLTANVAVAVNPELQYAVLSDDLRRFYVQSDRADTVRKLLEKRENPAVDGSATDRFHTERRVTGRELVEMHLTYDGPFDHLPAAGEAAAAHRVIPWPEVSAQEGTGLVHIAPGCGEEDHALGREFGLPAPAPIDESGRFVEGYGEFTGVEAGASGEAVAAELRRRGVLVGEERYTHSYPHCWRCGRELLYRLVDEWYIAMDPWREEIKDVVKQIEWIPSYGRELELDWLDNMHDWMISKKRYWGLALPIWASEDGRYFEVLGSKKELRDRAISGWNRFEGHSPHRPWIDEVRIEGPGGMTLSRIPDVGNPWLDAGIIPYSTTGYRVSTGHEPGGNSCLGDWRQWVPADLVLESFPGQFRNWFYSLLAMSTMMEGIPPFKTLVGHAMVRDENGEEMHKSKGNAIWFDDAVAKAGSDVLRWLFLSHDIRNNINFGYDETERIRGKLFNTVWNSHAFFVNYARLAEYIPPATHAVTESAGTDHRDHQTGTPNLLDRWILVNLGETTTTVRKAFENHTPRHAVKAIEEFVDSLSNWYIRHSRRRFWRGETSDERSGFDTLYRCLETLCRLMAPIAPMFADAVYRNITAADPTAQESVHCTSFPDPDELPKDEDILEKMDTVIEVTTAALNARKKAGIKVRQPLSMLTVCPAGDVGSRAVTEMTRLIEAEVNVKAVELAPPGDPPPSEKIAELDMRKAGPKFGQRTPAVVAAFNPAAERITREISAGAEEILLTLEPSEQPDRIGTIQLTRDDLRFVERTPSHLSVAEIDGGWVALYTRIPRPLRLEGLVREVVRRVQVLRKDSGLAVEDRIEFAYTTTDADLREALTTHTEYLASELLAIEVKERKVSVEDKAVAGSRKLSIDDREIEVSIKRAGVV